MALPRFFSKRRIGLKKRFLLGALVAALLLGLLVFTVFNKNTLPSSTTDVVSNFASPSPSPTQLSPEEVVVALFSAIQNKDKVLARTYLSPEVNKAAFASTLEENTDTPSLYDRTFEFQVSETKISTDGELAFVLVDIQVAETSLPTSVVLQKQANGNWLATSSEAIVTDQKDISLGREAPTPTGSGLVQLYLDGPAELLMTSPEGLQTGRDPKRRGPVYNIPYAKYLHDYLGVDRVMTIENLVGTWKLQVIGTSTGDYTLATELLDPDNNQKSAVGGTILSGAVHTYVVRYPGDREKPLEVIRVEN